MSSPLFTWSQCPWTPVEVAVAVALGDLADALDNDHVWIRADGIRSLAGDHAGTEWEAKFAGMIRYAESNGWCRADAMIKAHLERAPLDANGESNGSGPS